MINFPTGNEISKVEGMEGLHDLRELVLDRNKIKIITELSFANQWNLQELHLEENRIRELTYLNCMDNLQRLYLGSNRVQVMFLLLHLSVHQSHYLKYGMLFKCRNVYICLYRTLNQGKNTHSPLIKSYIILETCF